MGRRRMMTVSGIAGVVMAGWIVSMVLFSLLSRRPHGLGVHDGRLTACPTTPNCVCSQDDRLDHAIEPFAFAGSPAAALARLEGALASQPRTRIVERSDGYLRAEATSLLFRFVDDVEFLLDAEAKRIHVRSASRAGRSDLGVNRRRVEAIRAAFTRVAE